MVEEAQIIQGCIDNDPQCKALLYKQYASSLYGVALRYTKTEADAQDVLQDAFFRIFDGMEQYEGKGSLGAWLAKVVTNQAVDFLRKRSRVILVDYEDYEETIADETIVESDRLTHNILLGFIKELPQRFQAVFNLCAIDGYSHREAAKALNCSESICRKELFKARSILKKKVSNFLNEENKIRI